MISARAHVYMATATAVVILAALLGMFVVKSTELWHGEHGMLNSAPTKGTTPPRILTTTPPQLKRDLIDELIDLIIPPTSTFSTIIAPIEVVSATSTSNAKIGHTSNDSTLQPTQHTSYNDTHKSKSQNVRYEILRRCDLISYTEGLHFMLAYQNGTLLGTPPGSSKTSPTFLISTQWHITYPKILLKAILNDPAETPSCPKGHCRSDPIPGTNGLRLVQRAEPFSNEYWCDLTFQHDIWRLSVELGETSRFGGGDIPFDELELVSEPVERYMAARMRTTYPTLEIGLIVGFSTGILVLWVTMQCLAAVVWFIFHVLFGGYGKGNEDIELKELRRGPPRYEDAVRDRGRDGELV